MDVLKRLMVIMTVMILAIIGLVLSCQRSESSKQNKVVVALVMKTMNNPFFIDMQKGAEDAAEKLNVELIVQAAEREVDVEKQMQIIENLIQRKVSAICVTPSGSREIVPAIVKANRAKIPVLVVDTRVDQNTLDELGGTIATFIGSDNVEGGRIAGKFIVERLQETGKIVILEGIPGHETGDARLRGFHEIIDQYPGIELIASQTANWERDQGFNVFQNILQSHPEVEALFACNDMMALGAVEANSISGRNKVLLVIGFDAVEDGRDAIRSGKMTGSVAQHPYVMGYEAVIRASEVINGQILDEYIPVKIEMITQENVDNQ
ncbi:MAG: sugar ABC transporter substrate-binding protein [Candidatus Neomarinimicrobiota bacterium]